MRKISYVIAVVICVFAAMVPAYALDEEANGLLTSTVATTVDGVTKPEGFIEDNVTSSDTAALVDENCIAWQQAEVSASTNAASSVDDELDDAGKREEPQDHDGTEVGDSDEVSLEAMPEDELPVDKPSLGYNAHVQNLGWQYAPDDADTWHSDGDIAGTEGESLRLEAIQLVLDTSMSGSIEYQVHVQDLGWQDWKADGEIAGSIAQSRSIESLRIRLVGEIAECYDVYYRAHVQDHGWFDWTSNGLTAGTAGLALRLEGFEAQLVARDSQDAPVSSREACIIANALLGSAHVQNEGWQKSSGAAIGSVLLLGTTGQSLQLEALTLSMSHNLDFQGDIVLNAHVANVGWQKPIDDEDLWYAQGSYAGTIKQALAIEAIQIDLAGSASTHYDIYYRAHIAYQGWLGWTSNGLTAGSIGLGLRIEALEAMLVYKGDDHPAQTMSAFFDGTTMLGLIATLPVGDSDSSVVARATLVGPTPYLFLPAFADTANLRLANEDVANDPLFVSSSLDGAYQIVTSSELLNIDALACVTEDANVSVLYVKLHAAYSPGPLYVMKSANIASMFLMSDDPATYGRAYIDGSDDHSTKTTGSMIMLSSDGSTIYDGLLTQIKGRGNTSWLAPKKPYQIKLDKKASLIDGSKGNKAKTWILLANYGDPTAIKNYLSYRLGSYLGLTETPECDFVDLYYDGTYRGTYLLSEKVEIKEGRVDIDEIENSVKDSLDIETVPTAIGVNRYGYEYQYVKELISPDEYSGGYLLESDLANYTSERSWFKTSAGTYVIKSPENASHDEVQYISEVFQHLIDFGNVSSIFDNLLDLASATNTWLVQTLANNGDYPLFSSAYFYKKAGDSKIYAGPLWDFDSAYGGYANVQSAVDMDFMQQIFYYNNIVFRKKVRSVFNETLLPLVRDVALGDEDSFDGNVKSIAGIVASIRQSQAMNEQLWGVTHLGHTVLHGSTYDQNISHLQQWLQTRLAYLDGLFNSPDWC